MNREVKQTFQAHGKLLLSGEYLVLKGAEALAIPLRYGQSLTVTTSAAGDAPAITWKAYTPEAVWFEAVFALPGLELLSCSDQPKAIRLQMILLTLSQLRPGLFSGDRSHSVETRLDFDPDWGFGSSSTLISALAGWAAVDPYTLLNLSVGGSGYDIACADAQGPLYYRLSNMRPVVRKAAFAPPFAANMYFVYSGRKQRSDDSIRSFNQRHEDSDLTEAVAAVSRISRRMVTSTNLNDFCTLIREHDEIISELLSMPPVGDSFPDFPGQLKSLGAWGGDFLLALTDLPATETEAYFTGKGMPVVLQYDQTILKPTQT